MKKITTHQPKVPWTWVAWMIFPWVTMTYYGMCSGAPLTFTIRKFVENPSLVALLSSVNLAFNFLVGAVTSYMSDRIWTRWGRRRPLLIIGWTGGALAMAFIPLAPNIGTLVVLIIVFQFCTDVGTPYEPLFNEVIPPQQRGRAATMRSILQNLTSLFSNAVMLAQFDRQYDLNLVGQRLRITGEMTLYWVGALAVLASVLFLILKVRETPPPESIRREAFSVPRFFREIFGQRQWWMVYLLYVCPYLTAAGIGSFGGSGLGAFIPLFLNEQVGFSKEQIGWAAGAAGVVNMLLFVPLFGILADRLPRLRLFQVATIAPAVVNLGFYFVARFVLDYHVPFGVLLGFGIATEAMMALLYVLWGPLIYDYVPTARYGTVSAGFSFIGGFVVFALINGSGLWVGGMTRAFGTAGASRYDYSSAFLWQFLAALISLGIALYFGREVRRGRIIPYARLEFEQRKVPVLNGGAAGEPGGKADGRD